MVAQKIRRKVEATRFTGMENRPVTVSIGICVYPFKDIKNIDELIARADDALYAAKSGGRNCVMLAQEDGSFKRIEN